MTSREVAVRDLRWVATVVIVVVLALGVYATVARADAPPTITDFPLARTRLSQVGSECDVEPRAASSEDGNWLGVVWVQRDKSGEVCKSTGGQAVVRWATEGETLAHWSPPITLVPSGSCVVHADIAITGTTAHLVTTSWSPCDDADADSRIDYFTCDMVAGTCGPGQRIVYQSGEDGQRLFDVRLVLDELGRSHVAYTKALHTTAASDVMYLRHTGSGWAAPQKVSVGDRAQGFYRPVMAASNGRIHFAWQRRISVNNGEVHYRYCDAETGECNPTPAYRFLHPNLDETTQPIPAIAAQGDRLVIVWNICADFDTNLPCERFHLVYVRSDTNGQFLVSQPREVGTDFEMQSASIFKYRYRGSDSFAGLVNQYATYPRPSVRLDQQGLPHIAWQVELDQGYVISTTYAGGETEYSFASWNMQSGKQVGIGEDARIAPALLLPDPDLDSTGLHIFSMHAWMEEDDFLSYTRSQVYYDYVGPHLLDLEQGTLSGPYELPHARAVTVRALVKAQDGTPRPGVTVTFSTDEGSFGYAGYGPPLVAQGMSDSSGWAEATVYANLPVTATVRAWLDTSQDGVWNDGETTVTLFPHWEDNTSPGLQVSDSQIMAGNLLTATLTYHPYQVVFYQGGGIPYAVWWCAQDGSQAQRVAGPFTVDVDTWSKSNLPIAVPEQAAGSYYLESRYDDESTPCQADYRIAKSDAIFVTEKPWEGTPAITVAQSRPHPGATIQATLLEHPSDTYELWWCPASAEAVDVQEQVGNIVVNDDEPDVPITVPAGVSGFYQLESHTTGGSCGNTATFMADSTLLMPTNQILLPLVMRR